MQLKPKIGQKKKKDLFIPESAIKKHTKLTGYKLLFHQSRKKYIIRLITKTMTTGSSVLDVGCSLGDISVELSLHGYKVHGIDLNPGRVRKANKLACEYGQNILFESTPFEKLGGHDKYDIVLLGEVLEHFYNPVAVLKKVANLLNPKGKVVITSPNMPSLRNRLKFSLLGVFPDNNHEHKYYFDYRRLTSVVSGAGYDVAHLTSRFTNILCASRTATLFENIFLCWFTWFFSKSGDTLIAVISPKV